MHFPTLYLLAIASSSSVAAAEYETVNVNVSLPQNNAPLNHTLAYYKLNGTNGAKSQLTHAFVDVPCGARLSVHYSDPGVYPDGGSPQRPVLLLNHGYPESAYIWRKVTPELSGRVPLFVPDRLGYGLSTVCTNETTNEMSTTRAILDAVNIVYGKNVSVILGGHDRGARSMHRAAVSIDQFPEINALGVWMADIVPIVEEYKSFSNPNYSTGYFHWNFLPRAAFALDVIMAYGGGNWVTEINKLGSGINATATALFHADDAFAVYDNFFNQSAVTNASVVDYTSGATTDYKQQVADQAAGRKIKIPTHVLYSYYNLVQESGFNVAETWSRWVDPSVNLTTGPVCCGQGHFIIELAPDQAVLQLNAFLDSLGVLPHP